MNPPAPEWLLDSGGPVIRYRTARELLEDATLTRELEGELLASPLCRAWLDRLPREMPDPTRDPLAFSVIHGADDDKLETSLGKLAFLGFHRGIEPFDLRCRPIFRWLEQSLELAAERDRHTFSHFSIALVGSLLSLTGHAGNKAVASVIELRRDTIYEFVREKRYDIYVPWPAKPPQHAKGRPLVDPQIYNGGRLRLPLHHDLHLFGGLSEGAREHPKIRAIVDYVLTDDFAALRRDYGMIATGKRRYMVSGWKPRLPRPGERGFEGLLASLLMMAPFEAARRSAWFKASLDYVDEFRDGDRYTFPKEMIRESRTGYWPWNRMRLEERRTRNAHGLESTFWVLKIRKLAALL
ncbi:MAG: hypothetical protein P8Y95_03875 [Gammaproteobacteria bacterium]